MLCSFRIQNYYLVLIVCIEYFTMFFNRRKEVLFFRPSQKKQGKSYILLFAAEGYAFKRSFLMIQLIFAKPKTVPLNIDSMHI